MSGCPRTGCRGPTNEGPRALMEEVNEGTDPKSSNAYASVTHSLTDQHYIGHAEHLQLHQIIREPRPRLGLGLVRRVLRAFGTHRFRT